MFYKKPALGWLVFGLLMGNAFADTTNVKTQTIVEVKKKGNIVKMTLTVSIVTIPPSNPLRVPNPAT